MNGRRDPNAKRHANAADESFAVIGATNEDTIGGFEMRLVQLPIDALAEMQSTVPTMRKLSKLLGRPLPSMRWVEVYFAASFLTERPKDPDLDKFSSIYYMNETALRVCRHFGLKVPNVVKVVKRRDLPRGLGKLVEFPWMVRAA
jgi:hypothetical protein